MSDRMLLYSAVAVWLGTGLVMMGVAKRSAVPVLALWLILVILYNFAK